MKSILKENVRILLALTSVILWGSAQPFIKLGYYLFNVNTEDIFSIILFAGVRFFGAGILTFIIYLFFFKEKKEKIVLSKKVFFPVVGISFSQTIFQYVFLYVGLTMIPSAKSLIIASTNTFFSVLLSSFFFRSEKLTFRKIFATILGLIGIIVLNLNQNFDLSSFSYGETFALLSAISNSIAVILMKHYSKQFNSVMLTSFQFLFGGALLILIGIIGGGKIYVLGITSILLMTYLVSVAAVAYSIWSRLLKKYDTSQIVIFGSLIPVFGTFFSWIILKEDIWNVQMLLALVLIVIGIFLVNWQKRNN